MYDALFKFRREVCGGSTHSAEYLWGGLDGQYACGVPVFPRFHYDVLLGFCGTVFVIVGTAFFADRYNVIERAKMMALVQSAVVIAAVLMRLPHNPEQLWEPVESHCSLNFCVVI